MAKQFKCTQCKESFDIELKGKFTSEKITNKKDGSQTVTIKHFCSEECKKTFDNPIKSDYTRLLDYILELYVSNGYDKNYIQWKMITSQISNMSSENNYKYSGMKYTLYYMIEIEGINLFDKHSNGSIVNLIPFYYDKACNFYKECEEIKRDMLDKDIIDNVIIVKKNNITRNKIPHFINMDEI